ncbi:MAG: hypothetical protein PVH03_12470, partial [Chloroflexota bacterium]
RAETIPIKMMKKIFRAIVYLACSVAFPRGVAHSFAMARHRLVRLVSTRCQPASTNRQHLNSLGFSGEKGRK